MYSDSGSQTFPHPETTDLSMPQDNKKKRKRHSFDDTLLISAVNDQMLLETKRPKPDLDALQTNSLAPPASNLATFGPCPHSPRKSTSKKAYSRLSTTAVSEPRRRCSEMTIEQFEHRPRLLGRGSFSSVSLFIDPVTKQRRALKSIIRYSDKCHNEFQHAESLGRHPNLVQYIERRPEGLLLEYADMNLDDYLARHGPISWQTIRQFLHDMLNGLWHIHRKGLCHNDIKEGNVLVFLKNKGAKDCGADSEYDRDTLKLGDFGSMTSISSAMRPARVASRISKDRHGQFTSSSSQIRCPRTANMLRWQRDLHGIGEIALRMAAGYRLQPHHNEDDLLRSVSSKLPDQLVEIIRSLLQATLPSTNTLAVSNLTLQQRGQRRSNPPRSCRRIPGQVSPTVSPTDNVSHELMTRLVKLDAL